jgi:nitrate/TMAO reductase-like tetraheme cytochrome c subunit
MSKSANQKGIMLAGIIGLVLGLALMIVFNTFWVRSSSNESCVSCHAHPESDASWKQ